jgi:hypothetical protein
MGDASLAAVNLRTCLKQTIAVNYLKRVSRVSRLFNRLSHKPVQRIQELSKLFILDQHRVGRYGLHHGGDRL